jgi:hypothetical protein
VLRRALSRLASSTKEQDAADLLRDCVQRGAVPVAELPRRERVTVSGTLRTVTFRPRAGVPALTAELYDGSGSIQVVWLGRRRIPGIEPGRQVTCYGRVTTDGAQPVIFNPRYDLRPAGPA